MQFFKTADSCCCICYCFSCCCCQPRSSKCFHSISHLWSSLYFHIITKADAGSRLEQPETRSAARFAITMLILTRFENNKLACNYARAGGASETDRDDQNGVWNVEREGAHNADDSC